MTQQEKIELIRSKTKGMRTAVLVTMNENGEHVGRPMSTQEIEDDGTVWFMTSKNSTKIGEIKSNNSVGIMYGDGNGVTFVSVSGKAEVVEDREKIKKLWTDFYKAWFKDENDPEITLIKVQTSRVEYWDYTGGKIGALADMGVSAVTGKQVDHGQNDQFTL